METENNPGNLSQGPFYQPADVVVATAACRNWCSTRCRNARRSCEREM